jgi:hypothetical protein
MIVTFSCSAAVTAALKPRTVFRDIEHALNAMILTAVGSTPLAWENMRYEPTVGTSYIQVFHAPLRTTPESLGYGGFTAHRGITQLNVHTPVERGTRAAITLADQLTGVIRRGVVTTYNTVPVRILGLSLGTVDIQKAWAILPVTINWHCYTPD